MYSQLILKRASAEGLARMAEMSAQDAYAYGKLWRNRNGTFRTEVLQCANELIRRGIEWRCAKVAFFATLPMMASTLPQDADEIIALRTWESQLQ